jgi:hypothetical protein
LFETSGLFVKVYLLGRVKGIDLCSSYLVVELSRAEELRELDWTTHRRLYLKEVAGRRPGPRRRGGTMISAAPLRQGNTVANA